ncbi:uncharacterized protein BKCO1_6400029 [Diplodia corticola]|uniref:F-box domain-containing protein n=1 Tax=Diplodia corticola TaxID=236234 RepID=A0A1J9RP05_9PEZI|nr:uncharacterized protein BKCO1_6400029 [Diplodia corticola]OJD30207.1 hypothetical protein BKCO1_6400029 [Diplodia corticola]
MNPERRTLETIPAELVSHIGEFLGQEDLGWLRMTSHEMQRRADFSWAQYLWSIRITFNPQEFVNLYTLVQSETVAKAIDTLAFAKADPEQIDHAVTLGWCCAAGKSQDYLTQAMERMPNLRFITINADTFDFGHITCNPAACPHIPGRHRFFSVIFQALKDSGTGVQSLHITECRERRSDHHPLPVAEDGLSPCNAIIRPLPTEVLAETNDILLSLPVQDLTPLHNVPAEPYTDVARMIQAATQLKQLIILNSCRCGGNHGLFTRILPTTNYSALRRVSLCFFVGVDVSRLTTFLDNNHQIKQLSMTGFGITGDTWVPTLELLRDQFSLEKFVFRRNSCSGGLVLSTWEGSFKAVWDLNNRIQPLGWPWDGDEWGLILLVDDDGSLFETVPGQYGMKEALSLFIQGYYVSPPLEFYRKAMRQLGY